MTRTEVLRAAAEIISGDREEQYGAPENSFEMIAAYWNVYLRNNGITGTLKPVDVAHMMALMKLARLDGGHYKDDSYIDACGYLAIAAEMERNRRPEKLIHTDAAIDGMLHVNMYTAMNGAMYLLNDLARSVKKFAVDWCGADSDTLSTYERQYCTFELLRNITGDLQGAAKIVGRFKDDFFTVSLNDHEGEYDED